MSKQYNTLRNPSKDYQFNIVVKNPYRRNPQKRLQWTAKTIRMKDYFESKGHEFISCDDHVYYFDGLEPMKLAQLRLYYDRCVYKDRMDQLQNWSQR